MRKTKIICTIGPQTCSFDALLELAQKGMNIARLNMSHGTHEWHQKVIHAIKTINTKGIYSIAILLDTKGTEVRSGDLKKEIEVKKGDPFIFTIKREAEYKDNETEISLDMFFDDVKIGDTILIDGGIMSFLVKDKTKVDLHCVCIDGGLLTSRRHLNIKGRTTRGPTITKQDWLDIQFGIQTGVDFIALSFVKNAKVIHLLRDYLKKKNAPIDIVAKIECLMALSHLEEIVKVSDGVMIARGDLGAEIPLEQVPLVQEEIIKLSKKHYKPVIVATHLLESMILNPTPTRAEVTDITQAVKDGVDAIMLSGETASGKYPMKALMVMDRVAQFIEKNMMNDTSNTLPITRDAKKEITATARILGNNLNAGAIIVFTRRGLMASLLSYARPNPPIFAFTNTTTVRRRLHLYWGVHSFRIDFSQDPEKTIQRAIHLLKSKTYLKKGNKVIIVSDILASSKMVETIQYRRI
jgi:pyruvate kinase